jgi:hypothetical protein
MCHNAAFANKVVLHGISQVWGGGTEQKYQHWRAVIHPGESTAGGSNSVGSNGIGGV